MNVQFLSEIITVGLLADQSNAVCLMLFVNQYDCRVPFKELNNPHCRWFALSDLHTYFFFRRLIIAE